jgi:methylmalonyl-CoA mutase N-terminal domain/subunit
VSKPARATLPSAQITVDRPRDPEELRRYEEHIGDPGAFPYTRGTRPPRASDALTAAAADDGTITRELSGEGPPSRSNEQFRNLLAHGATGLDVIGDTPTMAYMDPDHPLARHAVGNQGVSICRAQDWVELYEGIPLERISVSHSLPSAFAIAGLAIAAREHGIDPAILRGSALQVPLYHEDTGYSGRLPFDLRMRLALDSIVYATEQMPRFHACVEDSYYFSDGSIDAVEEMALGLIEIREIVRRLIARGVAVDSFAPRIGLLVNCRMDLFEEVAKIRASRRLYARMMRDEFGARDPRSMAINVAAHTSGATMTAVQLTNNIVRGTVQTVALMLAGVRAMEISAFDEALRTPSHEAHVVGLRTQQVVQLESGITTAPDPLGGSWYVERLTDELESRIEQRISFIEGLGDIKELCEQGFFRGLFVDAMVDRSKEVDSGERPVVGVNVHVMAAEEDSLLRDLSEARIEPSWQHVEQIAEWKAGRDLGPLRSALDELEAATREEGLNVMPALLQALDADASVGECTGVMRLAYGAPYDPFGGLERP